MTAAFSNILPDSLEQIVEVFERDWHNNAEATISDYLPAHLEHSQRRSLLLELIFIDMERRCRVGEFQAVVRYLEKYPEVKRLETVIELMIQENRLRSEAVRTGGLVEQVNAGRDSAWRHDIEPKSEQEAFGRFVHLERIGRGGMGVVYRAEDPCHQRVVAIKLVRNCAATYNKFRHEGEAISRLRHPNIVRIYETGEYEGIPYLAMELIEGQTLAEQVRQKGKLNPYEAVEHICNVSRAIEYAHRNNVLHRDLSPGNILVDKNQQPQIVDFGLAGCPDTRFNLDLVGEID